jgi:hypothetical protein
MASRADEFRRHAQECREAAPKIQSEEERKILLNSADVAALGRRGGTNKPLHTVSSLIYLTGAHFAVDDCKFRSGTVQTAIVLRQ